MNNKDLQGKIVHTHLRSSSKALSTGRSYAHLNLNKSGSTVGGDKTEEISDAQPFTPTGADKLASTVLYASRLRKLAKTAKKNAHQLQNELDAIDIFMFHPFEALRIKWDMAVMGVMLYVLIEIPFRICFELEVANDHPYEIFNLLVDIFLMLDVLLTFNTGFMDHDIYVTDRWRIARHYLWGWFWLDFITSLPLSRIFELFTNSNSTSTFYFTRLPRLLRFTKVVRMVKLLRVFKLYRAMSQWENLHESSLTVMFRLTKFLVIVFLLAHIAACIWVGIAMVYVVGDNPHLRASQEFFKSIDWHPRCWLVRAEFDGHNRPRTYLFTLYWAFTTLTTVGYGDITAELPLEIGWTILVMSLGTCLFGYIIGNVASVMTHEDETAVLIRNKIQSVTAYMRYREFPRSLANKIQRHYEYSWKRTQVYNEEEILLELPTTVRTEVALYIHRETIMKVPFLKELGEDVIPMLVLKLKPINASPRDVIIKEDYFGEEMYFVVEGECKMFLGGGKVSVPRNLAKRRHKVGSWVSKARTSLSRSDTPEEEKEETRREMEIHIGQIAKGDYFAEYAIILDFAKHPVSVRSQTYCDLFSMSKEDFEDISDHFPNVFDQVIMIGQKRYLHLMRKLQQKRRWATAALVRGVSLQKIEGEDSNILMEMDSQDSRNEPMGFAERIRRRRSLQAMILQRKESMEKAKEKTRKNSSGSAGASKSTVLPINGTLPGIASSKYKSNESKDFNEEEDSQQVKPPRRFSLLPQVSLMKVKFSSGLPTSNKKLLQPPETPAKKPLLKGLASNGSLDSQGSSGSFRKSLLSSRISENGEDSSRSSKSSSKSISRKEHNDSYRTLKDKLKESVQEMKGSLSVSTKHLHLGGSESLGSSCRDIDSGSTASTPMPTRMRSRSEEFKPKLSIHMLAKIKMWKNRAVMNVALNNMRSKEKRHRQRIHRKFKGLDSRHSFISQPSFSGEPQSARRGHRGGGGLNREAVHEILAPLTSEMQNVVAHQEVIDQRLEKIESMLHTMFEHAAEGNESMVAMARILGQLANNEGITKLSPATRALCHMDSRFTVEDASLRSSDVSNQLTASPKFKGNIDKVDKSVGPENNNDEDETDKDIAEISSSFLNRKRESGSPRAITKAKHSRSPSPDNKKPFEVLRLESVGADSIESTSQMINFVENKIDEQDSLQKDTLS